ncbi:hypothetical protein ABT158_46770 [Nonomuraea sp. NPDC001636]|uniref:hypothetical protein n=1 Tax=Nonomuraea sp. NPDC001636 TaxID=3154391 RepID=UPI00331F8CFE
MDRSWQAFLRRFDLEHTYRFRKQTLGRPRPKLRAAQAADRWTWLLIIVHIQLRMARRRGFRNLRPALAALQQSGG